LSPKNNTTGSCSQGLETFLIGSCEALWTGDNTCIKRTGK